MSYKKVAAIIDKDWDRTNEDKKRYIVTPKGIFKTNGHFLLRWRGTEQSLIDDGYQHTSLSDHIFDRFERVNKDFKKALFKDLDVVFRGNRLFCLTHTDGSQEFTMVEERKWKTIFGDTAQGKTCNKAVYISPNTTQFMVFDENHEIGVWWSLDSIYDKATINDFTSWFVPVDGKFRARV